MGDTVEDSLEERQFVSNSVVNFDLNVHSSYQRGSKFSRQ